MKLTHLASACVLVEHKNTKILCDPWLIGEEFYGSWSIYPELDIDFSTFDDVDYIYISHIHPDHMSRATLEKLSKDIPVLIHSYEEKYVKANLERWGRKVIELKHGEPFHCGDGVNLHIYAADDCDPEACFRFMGCGKSKSVDAGSYGIDTMAVIEDGEHIILNVNDCPYELSKSTLPKILNKFGRPDLLLVGYAGAGCYPQCWSCYTDEEKLGVYGQKKKNYFLNVGLSFLKESNPRYFMPFAGTYVLSGKLAVLEKFRVVPELQDALKHYQQKCLNSKGFLLNSFKSFDLQTGKCSAEYKPIDLEEKYRYIDEVLIHKKYDYEADGEPTLEELEELLPTCYGRYNYKRSELSFSTDTNIYIYLPEEKMVKISADGSGYEVINERDFNDDRCVTYKLDFKLLKRILMGPRYAHWNNAEIGSHIEFTRKPEIYERKLYYSMNFFHA